MILPPKRFQKTIDARYDAIRYKPWFRHLDERREKIPKLEMAWADYSAGIELNERETKEEVAKRWEVDRTEFIRYIAFIGNVSTFAGMDKHKQSTYQRILDEAYDRYCRNRAVKHITHFTDKIAPFYGENPRHVRDLWELDPLYYPTNYHNA